MSRAPVVPNSAARLVRSARPTTYKHRTALDQFIEHLRLAETAPPRRREPPPGETLIQRYFDHLRDVQGLSPHSLAAYSPFVRSFVAAPGLPESAGAIDALAVRAHVLDGCRDYSVSSVKLQAAALRSLDETAAR